MLRRRSHLLRSRAGLLRSGAELRLRAEGLPEALQIVPSFLPQDPLLLRAELLCSGTELRLRAGLLRSRAELRLRPKVLPEEVPSSPLPSSASLLRAELLRPGVRTELRLRWLIATASHQRDFRSVSLTVKQIGPSESFRTGRLFLRDAGRPKRLMPC